MSASARPANGSSGDTLAIATARSARAERSKPGLADTLATRLPMKTRREKSSLSDDSVPSTLPRRTLTDCDRERTTTASAASAPAFFARSISWLARERSVEESISEDMIWPFLRVPFIVHYEKHHCCIRVIRVVLLVFVSGRTMQAPTDQRQRNTQSRHMLRTKVPVIFVRDTDIVFQQKEPLKSRPGMGTDLSADNGQSCWACESVKEWVTDAKRRQNSRSKAA